MPTSRDLAQKLCDMFDPSGYRHNVRLPPERQLCETLGTTRHRLRSALAELEAEGQIWRHVGRGSLLVHGPF